MIRSGAQSVSAARASWPDAAVEIDQSKDRARRACSTINRWFASSSTIKMERDVMTDPEPMHGASRLLDPIRSYPALPPLWHARCDRNVGGAVIHQHCAGPEVPGTAVDAWLAR